MTKSFLFLLCAALCALIFTPAVTPAQEDEGGGGSGDLVTVVFNDAKIETVVGIISTQIEATVSVFGKVPGNRVSVIAQDMPVEQVLDMIANPNGWVWWRGDDGNYGLGDQEYYQREVLITRVIQKIYRPNNIKASELDRAIKGLLTPNIGTSVADDRTNKLIVNDLPQAQERIERFIREIDVQLITRVFYIRHADVADIAEKIETYKSGPGTIEVDEKTHQIIVTDLLSNIKKMELLIDILDVGPEIVIYDVNNIGIDGEDLEDLQNIIENIRTPDLLFEVNEKQGVFILEDVPEVHERVEQILAGFDQPVKQVLIQAEILSTSFSKTFNWGLQNFQITEDLFSAAAQGVVPVIADNLLPGGGTAGSAPITYANFRDIFPNATLSGDTISGQYLGTHVLIQYEAVYNDTSTRVLLQPRVLVKNQEASRIFVGGEEPFLTTFVDDNNGNNFRTSTQSTVTEGLTFEVTPSISNSYLIELDLQIDNDDAEERFVPNGERGVQRLIARRRQNVETILQIPSGQTRMIGGLISNTDSESSGGFPFLSSLPVIGGIFGQKGSGRSQQNLMIFITPTIVEDVLPRPTTEDGRRGRLVTDYDRVPGEFEMQQGDEAIGTENFEGFDFEAEEGGLDSDMLSGSAADEEASLSALREQLARRQQEEAADTSSNYEPTYGFGNASLNSGDSGAPASRAGDRAPQTTRPADRPSTSPGQDSSEPSGGGQQDSSQPRGVQATPIPPPPTETGY